MTPFVWYNTIFYIPLVLGVLLLIGLATGFTHDVDGGVHVDGDHGTDHEGGNSFDLMAILGFRKAPLSIMLVTLLFLFGGTGTITNIALGPLLTASRFHPLISVGVAFFLTLTLTRAIGHVIHRLMPTLETDSVSKADLVSCDAIPIIQVDRQGGLAQVKRYGDVYQIVCKTSDSEPIPPGTQCFVTEYDEKSNTYEICRHPLA